MEQQDRRRSQRWRRLAAVMSLPALLTACGGTDDQASDDPLDLGSVGEAGLNGVGDELSTTVDEPAEPAASDDAGDCDLIAEPEVERLFAGRFVEASRFGQGARGAGCQVNLQATGEVEASAAQLVVQVGPAEEAQLWLDMIDELPDAHEVDLGVGAVLQGRTNLDVVVDADRSLRIGASLVLIDAATGAALFDDGDAYIDEVSDNLIDLAEVIIGRL